jgi:hypothetical protein
VGDLRRFLVEEVDGCSEEGGATEVNCALLSWDFAAKKAGLASRGLEGGGEKVRG